MFRLKTPTATHQVIASESEAKASAPMRPSIIKSTRPMLMVASMERATGQDRRHRSPMQKFGGHDGSVWGGGPEGQDVTAGHIDVLSGDVARFVGA